MEHDRHEQRFETNDCSDDEAVEILLRLGLDFRDERGFPLRCVRLFRRQAEAAAKGIVGNMPECEAVSLKQWETTLEADARSFLKRRR